MKVTAFDYYDKERSNPIELELDEVKKNSSFSENDVTYLITKVFSKKSIKGKCVEMKMVGYKIPNTATQFSHNCPAKKGQMAKMKQEDIDTLKTKWGERTVNAWVKKGKVKMKAHLSQACPECGCIFWKDQDELPPTWEITSTYGKKKLKKRK